MMRPVQIRAFKNHAAPRGAGRLASFVMVALALLASAASAGAQLTFPVYTADFNHDGIPDALVLSTTSPTATIAFGSVPYGTFSGVAKAVTFPSACTNGFQPGSNYAPLVIADLNGDGIPDLAFDCSGSSSGFVGTMLGNGDGTFGTATQLPGTTGSVDSFLAGDFNQDGKMDLVAIGEASVNQTFLYQIRFYAGDGTGHFAQPVSVTIGDTGGSQYPAYSAVKPDLNGDGYPDLVLLSGDALTSTGDGPPSVTVSVFGNNRDGTFGVVSGSTSTPNTTAVLGSFNPDIAPYVFPSAILQGSVYSVSGTDLIVTDRGVAPGVFTLKNTSTATVYSLGAPVKTASAGLTDAKVGHVSGTAFDDVVATDGTTFSVLVNDGSGNYTNSYTALTAPNGGSAFGVADANFDGYADIYSTSTNAAGAVQFNVSLVSGSATATAAPITLGIGSKGISAAWTGNVNLLGSTATGTQLVNGIPSLAVVSSSSNPSVVGAPVTLTALVSPVTASTLIPSGLLTLKDNGNTLTSGALDATGKLSYTTSALTQGTHAITATYAGDTLFAGTISTALTQVVKNQAVAPVLTWATPDPITYGTPLSATQLDAVAMDVTGAVVPGVFTYLPPAGTVLGVGAHTLGVTFVPTDTADFLTATQSVVLQVLQAMPTTTLTVSSGGSAVTSVAAGSAVTLTAAVTAGIAPITTGQVNFCDANATSCTDINLLGTAQLTSAGTATFKFIPGIGQHTYKAVFLGTTSSAKSASAASTLVVTGKYSSMTTLIASGVQGSYALTATVNGLGAGSPSGNVMFTDSSTNTTLGTKALGGVVRSFPANSPIAAGSSPIQVVSADLNGDGKPDLILANPSGLMVTVLLGKGDGTYTVLPSFGSNYDGISSVAVADFNGDGQLDIATANGSTVGLFLGNGDGTFGAEQDFANTGDSKGINVGDFNGDGILDLAVTDNNYGITIMIGKGDGTFSQLGGVLATGNGPNFQVAVADFNNDGKLDLVFGNRYDNTVSVLMGNGDGTFQAQTTFAAGSTPLMAYAGDFNGDGNQDLVLTNGNGSSVSVLLGKGDGTFQAEQTFAVGAMPFRAAIGDLNGDGKLDLAVTNENDGTVSVLFGNGDGTFQTQQVLTAGGGTDGILIADVNGDGSPDIAAANSDGTVSVFLNYATASVTLTGVTLPGTGMDHVVSTYNGDAVFAASTSNVLTLTSNPAITTAVISWTPAVATIPYGTALGVQQLNASAATAAGVPVAGTFVYTPAAGTVLTAGTHTLGVAFTPTSASYSAATGTATITVTQATPVLTWATPASIAYGVPLSATQLDATVAGVTAGALPGVLTYTPPAGTILAPGMQTLNVSFVPTDAVDYTNATGSVKLVVTGVTSTSVTPSTVTAGAGDTTITITGAGFVASSVVQVNGAAVATTLVSPTMLTAVIPASDFLKSGTLEITVYDPSVGLTSATLTVTVTPANPTVTLGGPSTTPPGSQPVLTFTVMPYPFPLTATLNLNFAASTTPAVNDPAVQFADGGRTLTFTIPANSTTVPTIRVQSGTVAGTITVPLVLTANGVNVTPATLAPVVIVIPPAVPTVSSISMTQSGDQLTVVMHGFSNTREVTQAKFHFVGLAGSQLDTPDVTIPATTLFGGWFGSTESDQYGSTFTYTQVFNVSDGASNIQAVQVTLTNAVGDSVMQTTQ